MQRLEELFRRNTPARSPEPRPLDQAAVRARLNALTGEPGEVFRAVEAEAAVAQRDRPGEWAAVEARLDAVLAQPPSPLFHRPGASPPAPSVGQEPWPLPLLASRVPGAETPALRRALLRGIAGNPDPRRSPLLEALRQGLPPDALDDDLPWASLWDDLLLAAATLAWTEARLPGLLATEAPPRFDDLGLRLVLRFAPQLRPDTRQMAFDRLLARRADPDTMWRLQVQNPYWNALLLLDRARASDVIAAALLPHSRDTFPILQVLEKEPGVGEPLARALRGLGAQLEGRNRLMNGPAAQVALLRMAPRENLPAVLDEAAAMVQRAPEDRTANGAGTEALKAATTVIEAAAAVDRVATARRFAPLVSRRDLNPFDGLKLLDGLEAGRDPSLPQRIREWRAAGPRRERMLVEHAQLWGPFGRRALREAGR
ncbi:hypothetical protein [Muricoccus radiodurans]|uniref:hypothetical protein n=1 Tax=Muricoccus radiodurans TaxID=2231721 RepID=UPI003CEF57A3